MTINRYADGTTEYTNAADPNARDDDGNPDPHGPALAHDFGQPCECDACEREATAAELEAEYTKAIEHRWQDTYEAILGARLHFHASGMPLAVAEATYKRWSQLYHSEHAEALRALILAAGR